LSPKFEAPVARKTARYRRRNLSVIVAEWSDAFRFKKSSRCWVRDAASPTSFDLATPDSEAKEQPRSSFPEVTTQRRARLGPAVNRMAAAQPRDLRLIDGYAIARRFHAGGFFPVQHNDHRLATGRGFLGRLGGLSFGVLSGWALNYIDAPSCVPILDSCHQPRRIQSC